MIIDAQRGRFAELLVPSEGNAGHRHPLRRHDGQDRQRGGGGGNLHLGRLELMSANRAVADCRCQDAVAVRADLGGRRALGLARCLRRNGIDRPVPGDVAGEVEHQAVVLAGREPGAAAGHLHVEAGGFGRAQHRDQINRRRVEAGGEHAHRGERPDLAALEGVDDTVALGRGRVAEDGSARDAALADFLRDVSCVRDT